MAIATPAFMQPLQPRQCHVDLILSNPPGPPRGLTLLFPFTEELEGQRG